MRSVRREPAGEFFFPSLHVVVQIGSRGCGLWQRMFWLKIPVITGSHPLPETSVAVSEEDKANEGRAAVSWGSAEDGKEDHRQPLASGLTWAGLVPPTPDARGRAGPSAQTSTAKGRAASHHEATVLAGCSWASLPDKAWHFKHSV